MSVIVTALALLPLPGLAHALFHSSDVTEVTILHINDHHSHLAADPGMRLALDRSTRVRAGGFPALAAHFRELAKKRKHVLKLHAGNALFGDIYYEHFQGEADAALMNAICFDAFAPGAHEFGLGDAALAQFLDFLNAGECGTAALAANADATFGPLASPSGRGGPYLRPYVVKDLGGGIRMGVVGVSDSRLAEDRFSRSDSGVRLLDEADAAQRYIDELTAQGVRHIAVLANSGREESLRLASRLTGADVIISGGSRSLLGREFRDLGLETRSESYPEIARGADGAQVCVAQAWGFAHVAGEINVRFDAENGEVVSCEGLTHMPIANSFLRIGEDGRYAEIKGEELEDAAFDVIDHPNLSVVQEDGAAAALLASFDERLPDIGSAEIAAAKEDLCRGNFPNDGASDIAGCQTPRGSHVAWHVAEALREAAGADVAIQDAGGALGDLRAGPITKRMIYRMLPFDDRVVKAEMTGAEIRAALEGALDRAMASPAGGAYPYAAGLRWRILTSYPRGERFRFVEIKASGDAFWTVLEDGDSYLVATNSFIGAGRGGYDAFKEASATGRVEDAGMNSREAFIAYARRAGALSRPGRGQYSTISFNYEPR